MALDPSGNKVVQKAEERHKGTKKIPDIRVLHAFFIAGIMSDTGGQIQATVSDQS